MAECELGGKKFEAGDIIDPGHLVCGTQNRDEISSDSKIVVSFAL